MHQILNFDPLKILNHRIIFIIKHHTWIVNIKQEFFRFYFYNIRSQIHYCDSVLFIKNSYYMTYK